MKKMLGILYTRVITHQVHSRLEYVGQVQKCSRKSCRQMRKPQLIYKKVPKSFILLFLLTITFFSCKQDGLTIDTISSLN